MSWPLAALGDIAPAKPIKLNGYTPSDRIWHVTLDQIESNTGRLLEKSIKPLSEAGSSTHAFDDRHVLYSKLRPYLNKVLLPDDTGLGTTELVPMLPASGKLDRVYLAHYLKSKTFVNWISSQTAGAKMPRVSMNTFWEHEIPLPPFAEQKRIAAILDKADSLRRKRQQTIQLADQFLRALFLDMFGDPVTNPKGWDKKKLSELIKVSSGNGLTASQMDKDGKFPVYGGNGINGYHNDYMFEEPQLVIGRVGVYCGSIHITEPKSWITDNALYVKEYKQEIDIHFLAESLKQANLNQHAGKAAQPLISGSRIYPLEFINPPIQKQKEFSRIKKNFQGVLEKFINSSFYSEIAFNAISQKAFLGHL